MEGNYKYRTKEEIEKMAKEIFSKLTKQEIKEKADKYKKNQITIKSMSIGFGAIIFIVFFLCKPLISDVLEEISIEISIFLILLAFALIVLPSIHLIKTFRKTDSELAMLSIKGELVTLKSNEIYTDNIQDESFNATQIIDVLASSWVSTKLLIDNNNHKFVFQKGKNFSKTYDFFELINYEVYENGGSGSQNIDPTCNRLELIIRINDISNPQIVITYISSGNYDKNGFIYKSYKKNLQLVCSTLEYIINNKTIEQSENEIRNLNNSIKSNKEQLQELKEMLNEGLITEEEFEQKKKQILGL